MLRVGSSRYRPIMHDLRPSSLVPLSVLLWGLCACGSSPQQWVGEVAQTDAVLAFSIQDDKIAAYLCGGPTTYTEFSHWFSGSIVATGFDMASGDLSLRGDLRGGSLITPNGNFSFNLIQATEDSAVGLYSADGPQQDDCRTGVVVFNEASPPRVQGSGCNSGVLEQVTPDGPVERSGFPVQLMGANLFVEPVTP